ncbi:MAG: alpha-galactosidase, partial [Candidatus Fervidibacter sp.]|uniref:alpha-galactosidase n=1 Tax=Candidatus Fervidibacter sp. TaxID=3100871 RepID=UPI00404AFDF1
MEVVVKFEEAEGKFVLMHPATGVFAKGFVAVSVGGDYACSTGPGSKFETVSRGDGSLTVVWQPSDLPATFEFAFQSERETVNLKVSSKDGLQGEVEVHGELIMGPEPYLGRLSDEENHGVFSVAHGPVTSETAKTVFNRFNDTAVTLPQSDIYRNPADPLGCYRFVSKGNLGKIVFVTKVTTDVIKRHGIRYYASVDKSVFKRAPTGWCSWYYYYQNISQEEWEKNVKWLAENLRDFGLEWVQLDDGWQLDNGNAQTSGGRDWRGPNEKFSKGMKWVADIVKQHGMKPGIWLIPQKTDSDEL